MKDRLSRCQTNTPNSICDQYGNSLTLAKVKGCAGQIKRHAGIAWFLMDMFSQAGYSSHVEAKFIFRDYVPDQVFQEWQMATNRRTGPVTSLRTSTSGQVRAPRRSW